MNLLFECFIPGTPVPQPRPRVFKSRAVSNIGRIKTWKEIMGIYIKIEAQKTTAELPVTEPVTMSLQFLMPVAKSRLKHNIGSTPHTQTPDLDNVTKAVKDCLEDCGIIKNDSLIWRYTPPYEKIWVPKDEEPGIKIKLYGGENEP